MIYNIMFYSCVFIFFYHSITGNAEMMERSFRGVIILGFLNTFHLLYRLNRR